MKLHQLEPFKGIRIKCETNYGDFIIFDHIDGMYSYCWVEGKKDKIVHLGATTELTFNEKGGYYEIYGIY